MAHHQNEKVLKEPRPRSGEELRPSGGWTRRTASGYMRRLVISVAITIIIITIIIIIIIITITNITTAIAIIAAAVLAQVCWVWRLGSPPRSSSPSPAACPRRGSSRDGSCSRRVVGAGSE